MKAISTKQFENAVKKVLNGGSSIYISTKECYPFKWNKSKGHFNLVGDPGKYSKYITNTGRGGKESDLYLVCSLASGYVIEETKAEKSQREKKEAAKILAQKKSQKIKREAKKAEFLKEAESLGLTGKEYTAKLKELKKINDALFSEYMAKKQALLDTFEGKDAMFLVLNRVKFARILEASGLICNSKKIEDIL